MSLEYDKWSTGQPSLISFISLLVTMSSLILTEEEKNRHYEMFGVRQPCLPSGVTIRRARLDDRDAILDMSRTSDIYEGRDSLSIRYQEYMDDPDRYVYLAEKQGQVVRYLDQ